MLKIFLNKYMSICFLRSRMSAQCFHIRCCLRRKAMDHELRDEILRKASAAGGGMGRVNGYQSLVTMRINSVFFGRLKQKCSIFENIEITKINIYTHRSLKYISKTIA